MKIKLFGRKKKKEEVKEEPVDEPEEIEPRQMDEMVKTPIDELFELVMKKGSLKIKDAAKAFGVERSQMDAWAKILEDHDLIEIHYPPIGEPEIRKKTLAKIKKGR